MTTALTSRASLRPASELLALDSMPNRRYFLVLALLFACVWIGLAIAPWDRRAWILQNILLVGAIVGLAASRRRFSFSRVSYTLIFVFLCLAEVGAHYTYPNTPYDAWFTTLTGRSLNAVLGWERNNFDRIVHFCYGFLLVYPVRELFLRVVDVRGFWGYALPLDVVMSTSMLFELLEWVTAAVFGGGDIAFIGAQGDLWDAQKDMATASMGALIAMCITIAVNALYQRDFGREWVESLRVKRKWPLDPDGIAWLERKRK